MTAIDILRNLVKFMTRNWWLIVFIIWMAPIGDLPAASLIWIKAIDVEGNRKTKHALILREIDFKQGDSLDVSRLSNRLEYNQTLLMNTGLFNDVEINIREWNDEEKSVHLSIKVVESWYIFPLPIFQLADRNLNVWWTEHNASLKRVNYGLRFLYINFSGNKDNLKLILQAGYLRKVLLQYERPYINREKTLGFTGRFFFDHRREFPFETRYNKRQFYEDLSEINFKTIKSTLSLHYRPRVRSNHEIFLKYEDNRVTDGVLDLNLRYLNGDTRQRYVELAYLYSREARDNKFYALKGSYLSAIAQKEGLGLFNDLDKFTTTFLYAHYFPMLPVLNLEMRVKTEVEWTGNSHPYFGLEALGFGETYIRGYELYVVDGTDFLLSRNSLRFRLFDRSFDLKKKMPFKNYRIFPVAVWLTANTDFGYVNNDLFNEDNPFNNRWLVGGGLGIDMILYRKYVFQIEYSINHIGEKGIFLHVRSDL